MPPLISFPPTLGVWIAEGGRYICSLLDGLIFSSLYQDDADMGVSLTSKSTIEGGTFLLSTTRRWSAFKREGLKKGKAQREKQTEERDRSTLLSPCLVDFLSLQKMFFWGSGLQNTLARRTLLKKTQKKKREVVCR